MNRNDSDDREGQDLVASNVAPKENEVERSASKESMSVREESIQTGWSKADALGRQPSNSFPSCMASSNSEQSKKSRTKIINSALATLKDEGVSLSEILSAIDPSLRRIDVTNARIGKSPVAKDESPIVPRRSSEPCLPAMLAIPEIRRRSTQTDAALNDFSTLTLLPEEPRLTSPPLDESRKITRKSKSGFEGMLLECPNLEDNEMDSDLTKTDPEDDSSQERSEEEKIIYSSSPKSSSKIASKCPRRRRHRRKQQGEDDLPIGDALISPFQFNRRSMPSGDSSIVELSGSPPSSAILSVGPRGTRGRGRSPREYRSARRGTGRDDRRRSTRLDIRPSSLDEVHLTPRKSNQSGRREGRWSVSSHKRNQSVDRILETPKRNNRGGMDSDSKASDTNSAGSEVQEERNKKNQYKSPHLQKPAPLGKVSQGNSAYSPPESTPQSGSDRRAPTASGPTPSRRETSSDLREKMQTLECPPPL